MALSDGCKFYNARLQDTPGKSVSNATRLIHTIGSTHATLTGIQPRAWLRQVYDIAFLDYVLNWNTLRDRHMDVERGQRVEGQSGGLDRD